MTALTESNGAHRLRVSPPRPQLDLRVAVCIINWNTRELTRNCLRALSSSSVAADLDVVVVDNGSTDGSVDMIEDSFPAVRVIRNVCNEGFARANNQAFDATTAPYVLVLNSDTEVSPAAIERCRGYLATHPAVGAVGCRILRPDGSRQNSVFRFPSLRGVVSTSLWLVNAFPSSPLFNHDRYGSAHPDVPTDVDVVMGSFLMVRRADLDGQLFDDGFFMYAEEADLCRRLRGRGQQVVFLPDVSVMHVEGASTRTPRQLAWSHEAKKRAQLRYLFKWHGARAAYAANVIMLIGMVPRAIVWSLGDLRGGRRGEDGARYKVRSLLFHVRCLIQPSVMTRRQAGPPDG